MKKIIIVNLLLLFSFSSSLCFADIYKCKMKDGSIKFQDKPCRKAEQTISHKKPSADILGGYKSCAELKERVYGKSKHMLENDMDTFKWNRVKLDRALSHCGLRKSPPDILE